MNFIELGLWELLYNRTIGQSSPLCLSLLAPPEDYIDMTSYKQVSLLSGLINSVDHSRCRLSSSLYERCSRLCERNPHLVAKS
jgi:hypothetical protein